MTRASSRQASGSHDKPVASVSREWVMPSKWTFTMKPVQKLFGTYILPFEAWADPFAGFNSPATYTNDIEQDRPTAHHLDALDFLKSFSDDSLDGVLFDPPYSVEQCLRKYTPKFKGTAGRAEYWARCKDEIARIVKPGGKCISFCWDSTGIGKKRRFELVEVKLLCHGACHNDTIITIETKLPTSTEPHSGSERTTDGRSPAS